MQLWLIPIFPFARFSAERVIRPALVKAGDQRHRGWLRAAVVFVGVENAQRRWAFSRTLESTYAEHYYTWIQSGALNIGVDFAVDRLTAVMLMVVTGVGFLIHVYADRLHGA